MSYMSVLFSMMLEAIHDKEGLSQFNTEMTRSSRLYYSRKNIIEVDAVSLPFWPPPSSNELGSRVTTVLDSLFTGAPSGHLTQQPPSNI